MNSLEFINREIKITKKSYEAFDLDYRLFGRESDKRDSKKLLKKLTALQQIKAELEAWEVVSNPHNIIKFGDGILEVWYDTQKEENILKKALEVENE